MSLGWEDQSGVTGVVDLESGRFKPLVLGGEPYYLRTGHLAVASGEERVSVVPFDLDRLELTGGLRPVLEGVARGPGGGATTFAVSETGTLVYVRGGFERSLFLVEPNGRPDSVPVEPRGYRFPRMSPDGRTLSVTVDPRPSQIWIVDLEDATATPLTTHAPYTLGSKFSRDGSRLAWGTNPGNAWTRWPEQDSIHSLDVGGDREWLGNDAFVIVVARPSGGRDLLRLDLLTGDSTSVVSGPGDQILPAISPDGRWLAFVGDQSGAQQVYVSPIDGSAQPRQVTRGGGTDPRWSWDGGALFYRSENWIVAVDVTASPVLAVGRPDSLFTGSYLFNQVGNWDVLPDRRFLMIKGDSRTAGELVVVMNWFEELREGAGK